jgi:hypothetical protein
VVFPGARRANLGHQRALAHGKNRSAARGERPRKKYVLKSISIPSYNLGNFLRTLATPEPIKDWSLFQEILRLIAKLRPAAASSARV